jgi:hypothetical protein
MKAFRILVLFVLLILIQGKLFAQEGKKTRLLQEFCGGGVFMKQSDLLINNALVNQGFPELNTFIAGAQFTYRIKYKKGLFAVGYSLGQSTMKTNGFQTKSLMANYSGLFGYGLFYTKPYKVYAGLNVQSAVLQLQMTQNGSVQNLNNLSPNKLALYTNQLLIGGRLVSYLFDESDFPLIISVGYDFGTGSKWKMENGKVMNGPKERLNQVTFSVDIPIFRK